MSFLKVKKMDLLIAVYIFCVAAGEIYGAKTMPWGQIDVFGYLLRFNPTVAIFLLPIIFTINDIITEVHGKERTRSIIRSSLVVIILIFLFSWVSTSVSPSARFAPTESAYDTIFGLSMRFSAASIIAYAFSDFLDVFIFAKIREKFGKGRLWLRNNVSNFISQFADSLLFLTIAFYDLSTSLSGNFSFISGILIPYWLLRCAFSVAETPLVYWGVKWLKAEGTSR